MSRRDGVLVGSELWKRCPFCGDSQKSSWKAHLSINLTTALYFCHRCGTGGKFTRAEMIKYCGEAVSMMPTATDREFVSIPELLRAIRFLSEGPGSDRFSNLERFHLQHSKLGVVDVFKMKDLKEEVGVHLRSSHGSYSIGHRGLGYSHNLDPTCSLRIVEGPYDVIEPQDVCLFGFPSQEQLMWLKPFSLILCPDGDVWNDEQLFVRFFNKWYQHNVVLIEYIPNGQDPDEVLPQDRQIVRPHIVWRRLSQIKESWNRNSWMRAVLP